MCCIAALDGVYRCCLHRRPAEQCCEHVDRPTRGSTDRRWRRVVRHDSASSTALDLLVDTVTHTHTRRSDTCTAGYSWAWTHHRLCMSCRQRRMALLLSLQITRRSWHDGAHVILRIELCSCVEHRSTRKLSGIGSQ